MIEDGSFNPVTGEFGGSSAPEGDGRKRYVCPKCKGYYLWLLRTAKGYLCEDCVEELGACG